MGTRRSSSLIVAVAGAALAMGLFAGCAGDGGGAGTAGTAGTSPDPSATIEAPPSTGEPTTGGQSTGSPDPGGPPGRTLPPGGSGEPSLAEITLTGDVVEGVEAGCTILKTDKESYLLIGGDPNIVKPGRRVTVRGRVAFNVLTMCQQGTPFQVREAKAA